MRTLFPFLFVALFTANTGVAQRSWLHALAEDQPTRMSIAFNGYVQTRGGLDHGLGRGMGAVDATVSSAEDGLLLFEIHDAVLSGSHKNRGISIQYAHRYETPFTIYCRVDDKGFHIDEGRGDVAENLNETELALVEALDRFVFDVWDPELPSIPENGWREGMQLGEPQKKGFSSYGLPSSYKVEHVSAQHVELSGSYSAAKSSNAFVRLLHSFRLDADSGLVVSGSVRYSKRVGTPIEGFACWIVLPSEGGDR